MKPYLGRLAVHFTLSPQQDTPTPVTLTLAMISRPPKSAVTHVEIEQTLRDLTRSVRFQKVPEADYLLIGRAEGFRPFVRAIRFGPDTPTVQLAAPLDPIRARSDDDVLVRVGERHPLVENVGEFLIRFGYLQERCACHVPDLCEHVSAALLRFQRIYRLQPTGTLTIETLLLMLKPRCAVPDIRPNQPANSSAGPPGVTSADPIVFMGNRWDTFDLRYRQFDGTDDITNEWNLVRASLDRWSQVSPLTFREVREGASDVEFDFRRPDEASYPFDKGGTSSGNVLAHAWGPTNGLVEFDDFENWGSTSLPAVSTHEIGHALGLDHSSVKEATMFAWYDTGQESLHEVDVRGIKSLYAPVFQHSGPFVTYPLFAFQTTMGTDSVTIDLGAVRHFLAWGSITMIDSLIRFDRDNMCFIDVFEVDGSRTTWRSSGGDHFGSATSPGNVFEGAVIGYGRRITFRITAGHVDDLEVSGVANVLVLS